jgi:hypothetical protein
MESRERDTESKENERMGEEREKKEIETEKRDRDRRQSGECIQWPNVIKLFTFVIYECSY